MNNESQKTTKLNSWAAIAEITSSIAIVVTLLLLFFEVRNNTQTIERESLLSRSVVDSQFFISNPKLSEILEKIKQTDGEYKNPEPLAFQKAYNLTYKEADLWVRYATLEWTTAQANFLYGNERDRERMAKFLFPALLVSPDQMLYWDVVKNTGRFDQEFVEFVKTVEASMND